MCDTCGKILKTGSSWKNHKKIHVAQKEGIQHECTLCGKTFTMKAFLRDHMKRHTDKRPFICDLCGKDFKSNPHLNRHKLTHNNSKPLTCEHCGKGFGSQYNLKSHLRTHTGEKPFKCDMCPAAFTHNVSLKSHKKSAHGIDLWSIQQSQVLKTFDDSVLKGSLQKIIQAKMDEDEAEGVPNIKVEPGTGKETLQREAERCADQLQKKAEEDQVSSEKTSEEATSRGLGISNQEQQGKDAGMGCPVAMAMAATNLVGNEQQQQSSPVPVGLISVQQQQQQQQQLQQHQQQQQQHQVTASHHYHHTESNLQQQQQHHHQHQQQEQQQHHHQHQQQEHHQVHQQPSQAAERIQPHPLQVPEQPHLSHPTHHMPHPLPVQGMIPPHGVLPARLPVSSQGQVVYDMVNIPFQRPHNMYNYNQNL